MKAEKHYNTAADLKNTAEAIIGTYNSVAPFLRTMQLDRVRTLMRMSFILGRLCLIQEQEEFKNATE